MGNKTGNGSSQVMKSMVVAKPCSIGLKVVEDIDNELIRSYVLGDESAFMALVSKYKDPITNYINAMIGDYERAVDLSQETFLRIYKNAENYKNTYQFSTWIYRIATNLAIDEIRWRHRHRRLFFTPHTRSDSDEDHQELVVPDSRYTPDEALIRKEKSKVIAEAIQSLPKKYRSVFVLKEIEDLPYEKIAEVLACSCGTVKSRLHRARELLKKKLQKYLETWKKD
jgi:RNA polymerase sigma-70 factor (ECF subfamily)